MERYDWPGNVRQLRNVVEQSVVLSDGDSIREQDISRLIRGVPGRPPVSPSGAPRVAITVPAVWVNAMPRRRKPDCLPQPGIMIW